MLIPIAWRLLTAKVHKLLPWLLYSHFKIRKQLHFASTLVELQNTI